MKKGGKMDSKGKIRLGVILSVISVITALTLSQNIKEVSSMGIKVSIIDSNFFANTSLSTATNQTTTYRRGGTEINITLTAIVNGNSFDISSLVSNIIQLRQDGYKFAPNITIPGGVPGTLIRNSNNRELQFNISANVPLETYNNGFSYITKKPQRVIFDFSDILNSFTISKNTTIIDEDTGKEINVIVNESVPLVIEINNNSVLLRFNFSQVNLSSLNNIFLDPTISVTTQLL